MSNTLTDLRRDTSKVLRPVMHAGKTVSLTNHGREVARIVPTGKVDRAALFKALSDLGPLKLPSRK